MDLKIFFSRQTTLIMELQFHKTKAGTKSRERKNLRHTYFKILSKDLSKLFKKILVYVPHLTNAMGKNMFVIPYLDEFLVTLLLVCQLS